MLKNIFRHRRKSKNEPFGDENEPVSHNGSQSKTSLPNNAVSLHREEHEFSSHRDGSRPRNLPPYHVRSTATDVGCERADTEHINQAASSSHVTGHSGKYSNSGHPIDKRRRLSSVVNMILMSHSESKPRTRRVVASDLYTPGVETKDWSHKSGGIQDSDTCRNEGAEVFAIPCGCQSYASTALHGDSRKNRFRSDDSWLCSQCTMQLTTARGRHGSTVSSPPALVTPSVDSPGADSSYLLCQSKSKLSSGDSQVDVYKDSSHEKCNGKHNLHCDRVASCGPCNEATRSTTHDKGKHSSVENIIDFDSMPYRRDASYLPSPLHMCDLECHESKSSDDDDDDDVPELVAIYAQSCSSNRRPAGDAGHFKQHSSPAVQPTVETEGRSVNESEMYILTDSFLDDTSTSFAPNSLQLTMAGHRPPDIMVADDYEVTCRSESSGNSYNMKSSLDWLPVVSPQLMLQKLYRQRDEEAETPHAVCHCEEQMWRRKPLSDWSTDDVLHWLVSVGLDQFYDTFRSKLSQIYYL